MKVWIIQVGEPLPGDAGDPRLWRSGLLARYLADKGHRVLWWATTFEHRTKTHRETADTRVALSERLSLYLIHSPGYEHNVSLARLRDHRILGRRFRFLAEQEEPPDIIHCGYPTIELSLEAAEYGRRHRVPVVLDTRDLWPDIFIDSMPKALRGLVRVFLHAQFRRAHEAFSKASVISGHTPAFVQFGLQHAGRAAGPLDLSFPFGYPADAPSHDAVQKATRFWNDQGIGENSDTAVLCYLGTLGTQRAIDLGTVIQAARILGTGPQKVRFVLCGSGPRLEHWRREARGLTNVILPGWVGYPETWTLMRRCRAGLLPYLPSQDFIRSIPNKAVEYLSAGLPVITSLTGGPLEETLRLHDCGCFYRGGDPKSLVDAVTALIENADRTQQMGVQSSRLFASDYSEERICASMAEHLSLVAGTGPLASKSGI